MLQAAFPERIYLVMRQTGTRLSDETLSDVAWVAHACLKQRRLTGLLAERSSEARTASRALLDAVHEQLAVSRASLDFVHERRRRSFQVIVQLARRQPNLRRFLPVLGAASTVPLSIEVEDRPEGHLIRVAGEIDLGNVSQLRAALEPAVNNNESVIMDLSRVTYLDSTTLNAIVTSDRQLRTHDRRLVVVSPAFLFKLLRVTGLDSHVAAVPSLAEATRILGDGGPP